MTAPNMAAITASLERSLQNCSLNHHQSRGVLSGEEERSSSSDDLNFRRTTRSGEDHRHVQDQDQYSSSSCETTLELNSHVSLPYYWEQCLDLKTGEIYYINRRNGMKAREDPRRVTEEEVVEEEEEERYSGRDEEEEDDSSYDSEESSSESSPASPSREVQLYSNRNSSSSSSSSSRVQQQQQKEGQVLVVAGCKSCLMYFMVPKEVGDCAKCNGQLLHFDRSDQIQNASSP